MCSRMESGRGSAGMLQSDDSSGLEKQSPNCHQDTSEGPTGVRGCGAGHTQHSGRSVRKCGKDAFNSAKC